MVSLNLGDNNILINIKESIYQIARIIKEDDNDLSELLVNNWNNLEKIIYDTNIEYNWPMLKNTFLSKFDLKKYTVESHIKHLYKRGRLRQGEEEDYFVERRGRTSATYITEKGSIKILEKPQSIEGAKYLKKFGINIHLKKCFLYTTIIKHILKGIDNPKTEFVINKPRYRIDLYLEKSKLPIECDEVGHEHESYEIRLDREEDIKKKLGCHEFLRFNPHDTGFNFEKLMKCIIYHILGKNINEQNPIDYYMGNLTKEELALFD
ncbi:MAG: hypothetical protein L6277_11140 [Desulfobacterales bacterium]|nr:hypothetical protein [Pseudomonadota bacterium]MCG2772626.1 hypothetical protein [Desulfobacterales bacterium]